MTLQRLVLDFRNDELVVRCLYRSKGGPNSGTKARRREVEKLARTGLNKSWRPSRAAPSAWVLRGSRLGKTSSYVQPRVRQLRANIRKP